MYVLQSNLFFKFCSTCYMFIRIQNINFFSNFVPFNYKYIKSSQFTSLKNDLCPQQGFHYKRKLFITNNKNNSAVYSFILDEKHNRY